MSWDSRRVGCALGAGLAAFALTGCKDPTEITFTLKTDVPCDQVKGVAIVVGASANELETKSAATVSHVCTASGELGTIVTVPSGAKNDPVSIEVVAGVGRDPGECQAAGVGTGCIVARRSLRYVPHTPLDVDVTLSKACNGVVCAPEQTCVAGACTSSAVLDPGACTSGCGDSALAAPTGSLQVPSPLVCGDMSGLQPGAVWPMLGYCPTRVGRSPYPGPQTGAVRWTAVTGSGGIESGIAIAADGTVYFGARDDKLYAASKTGQILWSSLTLAAFSQTVPAIGRDGTVYAGNDLKKLYAFDRGGGVKWYFVVDGAANTSPNVAGDGTIYMGAGAGSPNLVALAPDGRPKWTYATGAETWSSPAIGLDGTVYIGSEDSHMYAVRPDGTLKWSYQGAEGLQSAIVAPNGTIYFNGKPSICALNADGTLLWATPTDGDATVPALASDGTIYAGTAAGGFYAFSEKGEIKWQLKLTPFDASNQPVIAADGTIYIGATDGTFYAIAPEGVVRWTVTTGHAIHGAAALGNDRTAYFGADDGNLYAVGP